MRKRSAVLMVVMLVVLSSVAIVGTAASQKNDRDKKMPIPKEDQSKPFLEGASLAQIEDTISKMSGLPMQYFAEKYGIETIRGKKLDLVGIRSTPSPKALADRPVGTDPAKQENEPSIAVKPNNSNIAVAASHSYPPSGACVAYRSSDHGETWSAPVSLPLLFPGDWCSDPVVRWSPSGSRVYASYMSITPGGSANITVTYSTNNGATWSSPTVAIRGNASFFPDKPWLDVHTFWNTSYTRDKVYVTATNFYSTGMDIVFTRSTNGGLTWSTPPIVLASSPTSNPVLQGSRPIGGKYFNSTLGNVTACWYNSEKDGWLIGNFSIKCRNSIDYGTSFGPEVTAFNASKILRAGAPVYFEIPYWLGPNSMFHRWWGGMFPSMITTTDGVLHIVFTAAPENYALYPSTYENGDIYYVKSPYPYTKWTLPTQLNEYSYMAQGYPTITAKRVTGGSVLVAAWEDHRWSPYGYGVPGVDCGHGVGNVTDGPNCLYDTYAAITNPGWGPDWWLSNPNQKVTDASSVSDYWFIGDYIDASTSRSTSDKYTHVIWTDRSDVTSIYDYEDDVYSDQINIP